MSDEVSAAELVDGFIHPPRIVAVGSRSESPDGEVLIISHIELWRWRVVVRGVRADRRVDGRMSTYDLEPVGQPTVAGTVTGQLVEMDDTKKARIHAEMRWVTEWGIQDDADTEFRLTGASAGGSGGDTWADFTVEFHPGVADGAVLMVIAPPNGQYITVPLLT